MKLTDWALQHEDEIRKHDNLNFNINAIDYLETHPELINFKNLSSNKDAIHILEKNIHKIDWPHLSTNESAIHIIEKYPQRYLSKQNNSIKYPNFICWYDLSKNKSAVGLLKKKPDWINWSNLCRNKDARSLILDRFVNECKCELQIPFYLDYSDMEDDVSDMPRSFVTCICDILWNELSEQAWAIDILEEHLDKVDWSSLCSNPAAMHLIKQWPDKIDWFMLSRNPSAIDLLTENQDKIYWSELVMNREATGLLRENRDKIKNWGDYSLDPCDKELFEFMIENEKKILWDWFVRSPHLFDVDYFKISQIYQHFFGKCLASGGQELSSII